MSLRGGVVGRSDGKSVPRGTGRKEKREGKGRGELCGQEVMAMAGKVEGSVYCLTRERQETARCTDALAGNCG
jgi:hypothetical protein